MRRVRQARRVKKVKTLSPRNWRARTRKIKLFPGWADTTRNGRRI